jgi:hypothetical protein
MFRSDQRLDAAELPGATILNELSERAKWLLAQNPLYLHHFITHPNDATAGLARRQLRRADGLVASRRVLGNPQINANLLRQLATQQRTLRSLKAQKFVAFNPKADLSFCSRFLRQWPTNAPSDLARLSKSRDINPRIRQFAQTIQRNRRPPTAIG